MVVPGQPQTHYHRVSRHNGLLRLLVGHGFHGESVVQRHHTWFCNNDVLLDNGSAHSHAIAVFDSHASGEIRQGRSHDERSLYDVWPSLLGYSRPLYGSIYGEQVSKLDPTRACKSYLFLKQLSRVRFNNATILL